MKLVSKFAAFAALAVASTSALAVGPGTYAGTVIPNTLTDWSLSLDLPQYDGVEPLGSITVSVTGILDSSYTVANNSPLSATVFQYDVTVQMTANLPGPDLTVNPVILSLATGIYPSGFTGAGSVTGSADTGMLAIANANWAPFLGSGLLNIPVGARVRTASDVSGGNFDVTQTTFAGATATVTYTAIPEASTMGLLAPAGLLLGRRRRA